MQTGMRSCVLPTQLVQKLNVGTAHVRFISK